MSTTISRNPQFIQQNFGASPDQFVVVQDSKSGYAPGTVAKVVDNSGTLIPLVQGDSPKLQRTFGGETGQFVMLRIDASQQMDYVKGDLKIDDPLTINYLYSAYPETYKAWVASGVISPEQAKQATGLAFSGGSNFLLAKEQPKAPVAPTPIHDPYSAPVLGDTPYGGNVPEGLQYASGSKALEATRENVIVNAPQVKAPAVNQSGQYTSDNNPTGGITVSKGGTLNFESRLYGQLGTGPDSYQDHLMRLVSSGKVAPGYYSFTKVKEIVDYERAQTNIRESYSSPSDRVAKELEKAGFFDKTTAVDLTPKTDTGPKAPVVSTPATTAAYFDKVLGIESTPEVKSQAAVDVMRYQLAPTPAKEQAKMEAEAKQKVGMEAFMEASKEAQKEALATGAPVTVTPEKVSAKALELVSPGGKYEEGVPVRDKAAESARLEMAVGYVGATAKVESMLASAAEGKTPTTRLTAADVAALEKVGFEGLQDKTGLVVAKPSEINSYVDYLTGKGAADDAYGQPSSGVGLQPKTPFVYEFLGQRGEVMKGNLAIVEYERTDPTNPWKVVKVYKAPTYGPQPKAGEEGPKVPDPSGNVVTDLIAGGRAPLENLFKQVGEIGSGIGLGFEAIGEVAAGKGPGESRAAQKVREMPAPDYGYDVEQELFSTGIRAASDLIQKGETDAGGKDLEKLSEAFMTNPVYVLGNVGASAVFWFGPQAVSKGIKLAQTGVSVVKPLRVYEAERLAATTAKPLGIDEVGIQALRQDTPLAVGPLGYFLRPAGPASGRILYPELQVVGDAAKLGIGKAQIKIPTSPGSVIIRSGVDPAAQEIGVILPKSQEVKMVTAALSEEAKIILRGLEPPKVGMGPPAPRKLQAGEIAAKSIEDVYGEGFTGAKAGEILGTNVKVPTLAKDIKLMQEPLSLEADLPKLGHVGIDLAERAPEHIIRGSKLIKYQGKDPIASIITYSQKEVSEAAKVGAKRAQQIQKANEALEEMSKLPTTKPAPRVQERGLAAIVQQLEKDAAKAPDLSVLKASKTSESTAQAAEAAASAMLGAATARSLGHGGATGAERAYSSDVSFDYGYNVVRYPPGISTPEMAKSILDLSRLKVDLPLMSTPDIKVNLSDLYGLKTVPTEREDLTDLLGLSRLLDTSTRLDEGTRLDTGLRDLTATRQVTKQDFVFERTTPEIPKIEIPTIPRIRIPWLSTDKKRLRKGESDDELITPGLKSWLLASIESVVGGGPVRLEGYDSGATDFNTFMFGGKKGRGRRK